MIGPTGVGKTEIARRLARLANAPFIKVEATKFTEVGYVGRDVDSIIRDLARWRSKRVKTPFAKIATAPKTLRKNASWTLLPRPPYPGFVGEPAANSEHSDTRQKFRRCCAKASWTTRYRNRSRQLSAHVEMIAPPGMEELTQQIQGMFANMGNGQKKSRKMKISEARKLITDEEAAKFVNEEDTKRDALRNVEQNGIVFY